MVILGYFFFAAFLAFLAGAFFAGMVFITPFRSKRSVPTSFPVKKNYYDNHTPRSG